MAIQTAETAKPKAGKKAVAHIEIHPKLGGGHMIRHVYHGFGHEPKEVHFNADGKSQGGEQVLHHVSKHAGLPGLMPYDNRMESETEDEIKD